jgi:hypothetical protein
VASVGKVAVDIQVVATGCGGGSSKGTVAGGDDPPFDDAIIASGTDLWLRGTPPTSEDDGSDDVEMTSEGKSDFKVGRVGMHVTCISDVDTA